MATKQEKAAAAALEIAIRSLPAIVAATVAGSFVFTSKVVHAPLVAAGLVMVNETDVPVNEAGESATKATDAGIAKAAELASAGTPAAEVAAPAKLVITLDTAIIPIPDKPASKQGGGVGRESIYPFKTMEVMQSFFVPATVDKPKPWETLASTVSNAEKAAAKVATVQAFTADEAGNKTMLFEADGVTPKMITVMKTVKSREKGKEGQEVQRPELVKTKTFTIREVEENGVKGARVWRTA
jgi:hypothetical protein